MTEKYSHLHDPLTAIGFLVNALEGGGDAGQSFPRSDAEDLSRGLRFIPGEVTVARRRGEHIEFVQSCENHCCWYWQFPDGSRTYYWERSDWLKLAEGSVSKCPNCGNPPMTGRVAPQEIR